MARIAFVIPRERFLFPIVEAMLAGVSLELCGRDKGRPALLGRRHPTSPNVTFSFFHRTVVDVDKSATAQNLIWKKRSTYHLPP